MRYWGEDKAGALAKLDLWAGWDESDMPHPKFLRAIGLLLVPVVFGLTIVPGPAFASDELETSLGMIVEQGGLMAPIPHFYHPGNAVFSLSGDSAALSVRVEREDGSSLTLDFAAPRGRTLEEGEYEHAQRVAFRQPGAPGIDVHGLGVGCNKTDGRFRVNEITTDPNGGVASVWIVFEQTCEFRLKPTVGEIRYLVRGDGGQALVSPRELRWREADPMAPMPLLPVTVVNPGAVPVSVGASTLSGPSAAEYEIEDDGCAATTLAPSASCRVLIRYTPESPGMKRALLSVPELAGSSHTVLLEGEVASGVTRAEFQSEPGDWIGQGKDYEFDSSTAEIQPYGDYELIEFPVRAFEGDSFGAVFEAPRGGSFVPGETYTSGLRVRATGRACNTWDVRFTVDELYVNQFGELERVGIRFEHRCYERPALRGRLQYRTNGDPGPPPQLLTVVVRGDGGIVGTSDWRIECPLRGPPECHVWYAKGTETSVSVWYTTDYYRFDGWGGDCSGTGPCDVTMTDHRHVIVYLYQEWPPPNPPPDDANVQDTEATLGVVKGRRRVRASGAVLPVPDEPEVRAVLLRRSAGRFEALNERTLPLDAQGLYSTSFARPRPGRCRIIIRFEGDALHRASEAAATFRC